MRDPHVTRLRYRRKDRDGVSYQNPPPLEFENGDLRLELADDELTISPKRHFPNEDEARAEVEALLESWYIDAALRGGYEEMEFEFVDCDVIDRNPLPPGSPQTINVRSIESATAFGNTRLQVIQHRYAPPPDRFAATPDAKTLWDRYRRYRQGAEPLQAMAYFCLTFVERNTPTSVGVNRRQAVSIRYALKLEILHALGNIVSDVGDNIAGRKATHRPNHRDLNQPERRFVEEVVRMLIRRVGEYQTAPGTPFQLLTQADFPALPDNYYQRWP